MAKATCIYCGAPATKWCDFVIGRGYSQPNDGNVVKLRKPLPTIFKCDAPLCAEHAEYKGWIHYKGKAPYGGFDTIDECPCHPNVHHIIHTMTDSRAKTIRYQHYYQAGESMRQREVKQHDLFPEVQ